MLLKCHYYIILYIKYLITCVSTAVCEKCGAIGVKHAFYTKERRFCSRACARSSEYSSLAADSTHSLSYSVDQPVQASPNETKKPLNVS